MAERKSDFPVGNIRRYLEPGKIVCRRGQFRPGML
jgi:hypothetical protein